MLSFDVHISMGCLFHSFAIGLSLCGGWSPVFKELCALVLIYAAHFYWLSPKSKVGPGHWLALRPPRGLAASYISVYFSECFSERIRFCGGGSFCRQPPFLKRIHLRRGHSARYRHILDRKSTRLN